MNLRHFKIQFTLSLLIKDLGAHEDCVHTMAGGLWNDYHCGARFNYICGPGTL